MKILILASQHGNEYSGEKLHNYINRKHSDLLPHITYVMANPRAREVSKRYVEADMNRSYGEAASSYEQHQAHKIQELVDKYKFDLILDMHTTVVEQPPCIIVGSISAVNEQFIQASSIHNIVVMNHPIVNSSINGVFPQAISIELYEAIDDIQLSNICKDIYRYLNNKASGVKHVVYEVTELVSRSELTSEEAHKLSNFEMTDRGYYPVLVGEKSYSKHTHYLGFKAYRRYEYKV